MSGESNERVLIVDDDVRVVELLQITLGGRGYEVITAYDGDAAWETIQSQQPDLIVLDVRLPRKSGLEVLKLVRNHRELGATPIVLISANAATESRLQGLKLGADDYLTKPFSPRELILRLRRILSRSRDRDLLLTRNEILETEVRRGKETLLQMQDELSHRIGKIGNLMTRVLEMNHAGTIEDVLERFVVSTVGGLEFQRVGLLTPDGNGQFAARVCRGIPESAVRSLSLPEDGSIVRMVKAVGRPLRLDEFQDYPDAKAELGRLSAAGITLVVPAFSGTEMRGILGMGERDHSVPLGRHDIKVLQILGGSIATALRNAEDYGESQRTFLETTARLIKNIEDRYPYMCGHSERVKEIALAIGRRLGQSDAELGTLRYAALLHDLGELDRYNELMEANRVLTGEERRELRQGAAARGESLLGAQGQGRIREILRHHQEYWDGTGYPDRLRGLEIPLAARIVSLANAWDALTHDRPHRPAYSREDAEKILHKASGRQFDPDLVPVLLEYVAEQFAERTERTA